MGNSEVEMKTFKAQVVSRLAAQGKRYGADRTLRSCSCSPSNEYPANPHFPSDFHPTANPEVAS
jgi:hypothetical protein